MPVGRQQEVAFTRFLLFGSLLISIVLAGIATVRGELPVSGLAALLVATAAAWFLISSLVSRGRPVTWLISLAVLNLVLVVPELALRVGGFSYGSGIELQLTEEKAFQKLVRDPELFWKYDSERPEVNSWGFVGPEVEIPKPPGVFRVLYLGDSCADWGRPRPYPAVVERLLNEGGLAEGVGRVESVSLSIAGYTSHQGLMTARRFGALVEPDVVVLHYGWNDHWLAYGGPDDEVATTSPLREFFDGCYRSSRLLQYAHLKARQSRQSEAGRADGRPADLRHLLGSELRQVSRVSATRYRENLLEIERLFAALDVPVVFVTPPSAHRELGTPEHFVELGYAVDRQSVIDLHTEYVGIVREVARDSGEHLLDLEAEMQSLTPDELREIFLFDGIHYDRAGVWYVARRVADYLRAEFGI